MKYDNYDPNYNEWYVARVRMARGGEKRYNDDDHDSNNDNDDKDTIRTRHVYSGRVTRRKNIKKPKSARRFSRKARTVHEDIAKTTIANTTTLDEAVRNAVLPNTPHAMFVMILLQAGSTSK